MILQLFMVFRFPKECFVKNYKDWSTCRNICLILSHFQYSIHSFERYVHPQYLFNKIEKCLSVKNILFTFSILTKTCSSMFILKENSITTFMNG